MGRSRYRVLEQNAPHILTRTVLNWIPLFTRPATVDILLEVLRWRQQHRGWQVFGWELLENRMHLVVQADDLRAEMAAFKSWTARQLIDWLTARRVTRIFDQLAWFKKSHKAARTHQLWEEGSHPRDGNGSTLGSPSRWRHSSVGAQERSASSPPTAGR